MTSSDICCICLATAEARGGEFLVSPGCCGKWYHQSCIRDLRASGKDFCPACLKPFPGSPTTTPALPAQNVFLPTPPQQQQQQQQVPPGGVFQGLYSRTQNMFRSHRNIPTPAPPAGIDTARLMAEELLDDTPLVTAGVTTTPIVESDQSNQLKISITPECNPISIDSKDAFYVQISASFQDTTPVTKMDQVRNGIDCVCILDNSGSMSGSKMQNLKFAVEYVISMLTEKDRLSIVTFNSSASVIHGLLKMTTANKETAKAMLRTFDAEGGTDIYDGMRTGWNILKNRHTRNPATCVFLLTDGQDQSNLVEKKRLAAEMRESGTALFVYGFGADHDSEHMNSIANAGEGSFVYIETNDTVVDAFGGALGTQQGSILRNIEFSVQTLSPGVQILEGLTGSYACTIAPNAMNMTIRLADLFNGEKRDFIVKVALPASDHPIEQYNLLSAQASYRKQSSGNGAQQEENQYLTTLNSIGTVSRITNDSLLISTVTKNIEVDAQVMRLLCTKALSQARERADAGQYAEATGILDTFRTQLQASVSFQAGQAMTVALLEEIQDLFDRVKSRVEYEDRGGRAQMYETMEAHTKQRSTYTKRAKGFSYQTASSSMGQSSAVMSKRK